MVPNAYFAQGGCGELVDDDLRVAVPLPALLLGSHGVHDPHVARERCYPGQHRGTGVEFVIVHLK
jgi:hypothetical protein